MANLLKKSVDKIFPPFVYGFAYGSVAFPQSSQKRPTKISSPSSLPKPNKPFSSEILDLVFVVKDPCQWHRENLSKNPQHYWWGLRGLGLKFICFLQNWRTPLFYLTDVTLNSQGEKVQVKYGILSEESFLCDLNHWDHLYISGRLHKPVLPLLSSELSQKIKEGLSANLRAATITSLLLLPPSFTERQFYLQVSELSYLGDVRMSFAENPNKIQNIVFGDNPHQRLLLFRELYLTHLLDFTQICDQKKEGEEEGFMFQQKKDGEYLKKLVLQLPSSVQRELSFSSKNQQGSSSFEVPIPKEGNTEEKIEKGIKSAIGAIVAKSSTSQTLKGLFSASPLRIMLYGLRKVYKRFQGPFFLE